MEAAKKIDPFVVGKNKIPNPLNKCQTDLYVGPPQMYPDLTGTQQDLLLDINKALKAAGLEKITTIYGGRLSKGYPGINFVGIGANGKFAWRKYDPSPGAGQNWVYIQGVGQMKTSDFVSDPKKYLAQMK